MDGLNYIYQFKIYIYLPDYLCCKISDSRLLLCYHSLLPFLGFYNIVLLWNSKVFEVIICVDDSNICDKIPSSKLKIIIISINLKN